MLLAKNMERICIKHKSMYYKMFSKFCKNKNVSTNKLDLFAFVQNCA